MQEQIERLFKNMDNPRKVKSPPTKFRHFSVQDKMGDFGSFIDRNFKSIVFILLAFLILLALAFLFIIDWTKPKNNELPLNSKTIQVLRAIQAQTSPSVQLTPTQTKALILPSKTNEPPTITALFEQQQLQNNLWSWNYQTIDSEPKAGVFSSMGINQFTNPVIAYFDDEQDALKIAENTPEGWEVRKIPSNNRTGFFPSIAVDVDNTYHISHFVYDLNQIWYTTYFKGVWSSELVVSGIVSGGTQILLDTNDSPIILFTDTKNKTIKIARRISGKWQIESITRGGINGDEGNHFQALINKENQIKLAYYSTEKGLLVVSNKNNRWEDEIIDTGFGVGLFPVFQQSEDGTIFICYYAQTDKDLRCARKSNENNSWLISTVDHVGDVGQYTSLAIGSTNRVFVSYYDETNKGLKLAVGDADGWKVMTLDVSGEVGRFNSIKLIDNTFPVISYYNDSDRELLFAAAKKPKDGKSCGSLQAFYRSGQTFLTWQEIFGIRNELYRIYRSNLPITSENFKESTLLAETGEDSSWFYANRYHIEMDEGPWYQRHSDRLIISDNANPLPRGTGLFVWTLSPEDFSSDDNGTGYYAVSVIPEGGSEKLLTTLCQPIFEGIKDPQPIEITDSPGVKNPGPGGHVYIQFMNYRSWNPTFFAPNAFNKFYGLDPSNPIFKHTIQYAIDYTVYEPIPGDCGGRVPDQVPVYIYLHGWRDNRYAEMDQNLYHYCAYGIYPNDVNQTWYFGFAKQHDYRTGSPVGVKDTIVNYTEQRILRMLYDLERQAPGPAVDVQRIYVFGFSMGGTGSLSFAERYPNVFAAAYAGAPMTNFRTSGITHQDWANDVAIKWGNPAFNLPIEISAPSDWANHLQQYNGIGVWDWQDLQAHLSSTVLAQRRKDDMAIIGVDHGIPDHVIICETQGKPFYEAVDRSARAWGGAVTNNDHDWANFVGLPPWMGIIRNAPFWNFSIIRDETVPGIMNSSGNPVIPPEKTGKYNLNIKWSSSWDPWAGIPIDSVDRWEMSFCSVGLGSTACGGNVSLIVDVIPRRLRNFIPVPGMSYRWENWDIKRNELIESGVVFSDQNGLLVIPNVKVLPTGNRLSITPEE